MSSASLLPTTVSTVITASLARSAQGLAESVYRLSTGDKYLPGEANPDLSLAVQLQADIALYRSALANAIKGASLLETAEQALERIAGLVTDLKAIAAAAQSTGIAAQTRAYYEQAFVEKTNHIDSIAATTQFGDVALLDGSLASADGGSDLSLRVGASNTSAVTVALRDASTARLFGGAALTVDSAANAATAETTLSAAATLLQQALGDVAGAGQQLVYASDHLAAQLGGTNRGRESLVNADLTQESIAFTRAFLKQNMALAALAQASNLNGSLVGLVGSASQG